MKLGISLAVNRLSGAAGGGAGAPTYDYYVATDGNDTNDGLSAETAWQSLATKLTGSLLSAGETTTVLVKAGTYTDQALCLLTGVLPANSTMEITLEEGVIIQWTLGTDKSATDVAANATLRIYGNGGRITGFNTGTGNGLGASGGTLEAHDLTVDGCVDGVSAHAASIMRLYDCTFRDCSKAAFAHIDTSQTYHYRCTFEGKAAATLGLGGVTSNTASSYFEDCIFVPAGANQNMRLDAAQLVTCRVGTLTASVNLINTSATNVSFSKCFLNLYVDGHYTAAFDKCFGKFSTRVRNGGNIDVTRCVFSGPATGQTAIVVSTFDPGSGSKLQFNNNIAKTATAAAFMNVTASNAGYLVAAASEFFNNLLGGSAAYDADLISADTGGTVIVGTVTADPLIGAANTLLMADYAYGPGSPAIGAGTGGTNIGFGAADVEELQLAA